MNIKHFYVTSVPIFVKEWRVNIFEFIWLLFWNPRKHFLKGFIPTIHINKYSVSHALNYGMPFEEKSDVNQKLQSRYGNTKRMLVIEKNYTQSIFDESQFKCSSTCRHRHSSLQLLLVASIHMWRWGHRPAISRKKKNEEKIKMAPERASVCAEKMQI